MRPEEIENELANTLRRIELYEETYGHVSPELPAYVIADWQLAEAKAGRLETNLLRRSL